MNNPKLILVEAIDKFLLDRMQFINNEYFKFKELPVIKWSKGSVKKKYRKITYGTYVIKKKEIRIHPILNNLLIPRYVLEFVIYHELLHFEDYHIREKSNVRHRGKDRVHTPHFHKREKEFEFKKQASKIMHELARGTYFQNKEAIVLDKKKSLELLLFE